MNEIYAEAGVKRKNTVGSMAAKTGSILVVVLLSFFALLSGSPILVPLVAVIIVIMVYLFPRLNVEYEYVFCDGQLDFDKIMGGAKRKTVLRIDFENVEMVAPKGSHALDPYQQLKVKDFSSLSSDVKPFVIVTRNGEEMIKIHFEPTEKMLEVMKLKNARKIVKY